MSSEETKIDEEKKRKEEEEKQAKIASLEQSNKELSATVKELKATLDTQVKTPLVAAIVTAKINAGVLKASEKQAASEELMKHDISYLQSLSAEINTMATRVENIVSSKTPEKARFAYQAEVNDEQTPLQRVTSTIRSKMQ